MFVTAWCLIVCEQDIPAHQGEPTLMRGDSKSAFYWVNRCGGPNDPRAGLVVHLLCRLELSSGWCMVAKRLPGVENVLADGIFTWPRHTFGAEMRRHTGPD